jgi:hypothetical protein
MAPEILVAREPRVRLAKTLTDNIPSTDGLHKL